MFMCVCATVWSYEEKKKHNSIVEHMGPAYFCTNFHHSPLWLAVQYISISLGLFIFCTHLCASSSEMTLKESLDECMEALDLFLNNHFSESLERLRPR